MSTEELQGISLKQMAFPPAVLNTIAPDISLQRHLSVGLRPCLREFEEFQNLRFQVGDELTRSSDNVESPILGSSVVQAGPTSVVCTITGGILESDDDQEEFAAVYPVVEVLRGKINGPPSDEEMIVGQQIYEALLKSKLIRSESLKINVGYKKEDGEIVFKDDDRLPGDQEGDDAVLTELTSKKNYAFALYATVQVFSRAGPVFDICYGAVMAALRKVSLPVIYIDENVTDLRVNTRNRNTLIQENHRLLCHPTKSNDLQITGENLNWSVTFGVVNHQNKNVLLADIEGDAEEACTKTRITVVVDMKQNVKSLNIINGDEAVVVQLENITRAIELAKLRATDILQQIEY